MLSENTAAGDALPADVTAAIQYGGLCLKTLTAAPTDPLEDLTPGEFQRLKAEARTHLQAVLPMATQRLLDRGRCSQIVARRMRWLLANNVSANVPPEGRTW